MVSTLFFSLIPDVLLQLMWYYSEMGQAVAYGAGAGIHWVSIWKKNFLKYNCGWVSRSILSMTFIGIGPRVSTCLCMPLGVDTPI